MSNFRFGSHSLRELELVRDDLVEVCHVSLSRSPVDFGVHDGFRSAGDQRKLYNRGVSQLDGYTKISKHQVQADGFVHAVDLVPWIDGRWQWDWSAIFEMAEVIIDVAREKNTQLRWGGCWQHVNPINASPDQMVQDYVKRKRAQGRRAFNDGPHWELFLG